MLYQVATHSVIITSTSTNHLQWLQASGVGHGHREMLTPSRWEHSAWKSLRWRLLGSHTLVIVHPGAMARNPFALSSEQGYAQLSNQFHQTNVILYDTPCESMLELAGVPISDCKGDRAAAFQNFIEQIGSELGPQTEFFDVHDHMRSPERRAVIQSALKLQPEWEVTHLSQVTQPKALLVLFSKKPLQYAGSTLGGQVAALHVNAPGLAEVTGYKFPSNITSILNPLASVVSEKAQTSFVTRIMTDLGTKQNLVNCFTHAGINVDPSLISEINVETMNKAQEYTDVLRRLLMVPPPSFAKAMGLNEPKPKNTYRVVAIGLEGAGKSTTMMNLAAHASMNHPFDVGHRGGVSHTQRLTTADVGRFTLVDTKGLPSYEAKYVESIRRFFRGYAKPGEEIVWEDLVGGWFWDSDPQYPPMDAMLFVVRYTTRSQARMEIANFFAALRRFRSAVVAITHLPEVGEEADKLTESFAREIGASRFVPLPLVNGGVCPHALTSMMEKVMDVIEIERQIEGKPL